MMDLGLLLKQYYCNNMGEKSRGMRRQRTPYTYKNIIENNAN